MMPASTATTAIATSSSITVYARLTMILHLPSIRFLGHVLLPVCQKNASPVPDSGIIPEVLGETFVRYDRLEILIKVPESAEILRASGATAVADPERAVRSAFKSSIGAEPLAARLAARKPTSLVVTISDITRPVPNRTLLPPILDTIDRQGVPKNGVTILIATGMHRPTTDAEKRDMLGERMLNEYRVVDHRSDRR
ncbi:MAG: hypothetical protein C4340_02295, partial [Armatimonadota bacterium]